MQKNPHCKSKNESAFDESFFSSQWVSRELHFVHKNSFEFLSQITAAHTVARENTLAVYIKEYK